MIKSVIEKYDKIHSKINKTTVFNADKKDERKKVVVWSNKNIFFSVNKTV